MNLERLPNILVNGTAPFIVTVIFVAVLEFLQYTISYADVELHLSPGGMVGNAGIFTEIAVEFIAATTGLVMCKFVSPEKSFHHELEISMHWLRNRPFSFPEKESRSNDTLLHFVEFSNVHNCDRSSNANRSSLANKNV